MIDRFLEENFFNNRNDKVFIIKTDTVEDDSGNLKDIEFGKTEIKKKVIQPITNLKIEGKSLVKQARIYLNKEIEINDIVIWKKSRYKATEDLDRSVTNANNYGYKYILDYLNEENI